MKEERFILLFHQLRKGQASPAEASEFEHMKHSDPKLGMLAEELDQVWEQSGAYLSAAILPGDFDELMRKADSGRIKPIQRKAAFRWMSIAASLVFLLLSSYVAYNYFGTEVMLTASYESVGESALNLQDGTQVYLNEGSTLTYPETFSGDHRIVQLKGEAYFDVTSNPAQAFIINGSYHQVKVLGTGFSFNEQTNVVAVKEGRVKFKSLVSNEYVEIAAGQSARYEAGRFILNENSQLNEFSWMSNVLSFRNTALAEVLEDLSVHFGQQFILQNSQIANCPFSSIFKSPNKTKVLESLKTIFECEIKERPDGSYLLSGGICN